MKERIKRMLQARQARKTALSARAAAADVTVAELRSINTEMESLNADIAELNASLSEIEAEEQRQAQEPEGGEQHQAQQAQQGTTTGEQRGAQPVGQMRVLSTYGVGQGRQGAQAQERQDEVDPHDTPEYRRAFMNYVQRGVRSDVLEFRIDQTTGTGDIGAVIPTTIMNKVVEKMEGTGRIWARVTKTGVQGGVRIPISSLKPVATYVTAGSLSDKQKKSVTEYISFGYLKLQCRVATELVAGTIALPIFEQTVANNITEAMIRTKEHVILLGNGSTEPLGITLDTGIPAAQIVEVSAADMEDWQAWKVLLGKMPRSYRNGAVIIVNDADWNKYMDGMTDANGQPIGRVTVGISNVEQERFMGKEVIPVEVDLPAFDDADAGDIFGVYVRLEDYTFNNNMPTTYRRYFDESDDEWVQKATEINDGKLADKNGVVLFKKKA